MLAGGPSNDYYSRPTTSVLRRPGVRALLADIGTLPKICNRAELSERASFWFGPAGTVTPLHHDTIMLFHTQIVGRKRWRFISPLDTPRLYNHFDVYSPIDLDAPDLLPLPRFQDVKVLEVVVVAGRHGAFLPLGWWHQVKITRCQFVVSRSRTCPVPNHYTFRNPTIHDGAGS